MNESHLSHRSGTDVVKLIDDRGSDCLIVARHGETEWNVERRLQGQQDVLLNKRGRGQAQAVARLLGAVPIDHVYSSTLRRCRETARAIVEGNVGPIGVTHSDLLKETALGVLEGELIERQSTPELTLQYKAFANDEVCYRVPDGESLHDVFDRVCRFFSDQSQALTGPGIHLIVAHRNVNKMIIKYLLGLSFEDGFRVEHENHRLYFFFRGSKELWTCVAGGEAPRFARGYVITSGGAHAC